MESRSPIPARPSPCSKTSRVTHRCASMYCATASRLLFRMRFANKLPNKAKWYRGGVLPAPLRLCFALLFIAGTSWAQGHAGLADRGRDGHFLSDEDLDPSPNNKKPSQDGADGQVAINFQDVDIPVLASFITEITNKNFILNKKFRA